MKPQTLQVLQTARERVARGWCQDIEARDSEGYGTGALAEEAVAWCLTGALLVGYSRCGAPRYPRAGYEEAYHSLCTRLGFPLETEWLPGSLLIAWNDHPARTQAEVLALLDQAAKGIQEESP